MEMHSMLRISYIYIYISKMHSMVLCRPTEFIFKEKYSFETDIQNLGEGTWKTDPGFLF